jgi:hypothetical protein
LIPIKSVAIEFKGETMPKKMTIGAGQSRGFCYALCL